MALLRIVFFIVLLPFRLVGRLFGVGRAPVMNLPDDHPEMAAAIAEARASLSTFRARLSAPEPGMDHFGIKARFPVPNGGGEHCWVGDLVPDNDGFTGKLTVEPRQLPGLQLGSPVTVSEDMITDWSYALHDVYQGHYTTRALMPHLPPHLRERVSAAYGWSTPE